MWKYEYMNIFGTTFIQYFEIIEVYVYKFHISEANKQSSFWKAMFSNEKSYNQRTWLTFLEQVVFSNEKSYFEANI